MELHEGFSELSTKALGVIRAAKLPHPKGVLLESFVTEAADRDRAAQHVLNQIPPKESSSDVAARLEVLGSDWSRLVANFVYHGPVRPLKDPRYVPIITRRDGGVCRFSGLGDSWRDRLAVYPILPPFGAGRVEIDPSLHGLLDVFLGPDLSGWVLSGCKDPSAPFGSHWLLRKSAAAAFAEGFWKLYTIPITRYEVKTCRNYSIGLNGIGGLVEPAIVKAAYGRPPVVGFFDESGQDTDMPDQRALELAARFSTPIRWAHMSRVIEQNQTRSYIRSAYAVVSGVLSRVLSTAWSPFSRALWSLWRLAPSSVRIRAYTMLVHTGIFIYGPTDAKVQRLPFGLFLKFCSLTSNGPLVNEYESLQLIRNHSDLTVPRPLDFVSDSKRSYMVTSRIPGHKMGDLFSMLSSEQLRALTIDLNQFLSKLRAIPVTARPGTAPTTAVTGTAGGGCHHVRMELIHYTREPQGPFATEEEFHDSIRTRRPPAPDEVQVVGHDMVMTHGDLSLRNIIVDGDGKLAGVVDWEHAGWYPTYWELTSFLFDLESLHTPQRLLDMADGMFHGFGDFEKELAVERRLWASIF